MSKYTFIINTYPSNNRTEQLRRCLESIYQQTYNDFEVLIVENFYNESDIKSIVELYSQKLNIKYIIDPTKKLSYLFNLGWKNAFSPYLAYVADDVALSKDWLRFANDEFTSDPEEEIGVVTGPIISQTKPAGEMHGLYLKSRDNILLKIITYPYINFVCENKLYKPGKLFKSGAYSFGASLEESVTFPRQEIDLATTSSMVIRRSVLENLTGFDEQFNFNHADGDLFVRVKKMKKVIIFNPKVVSYHYLRLGPSRDPYFIGKDTALFYKKNFRTFNPVTLLKIFLNILVLNVYWLYRFFTTKDLKQLKGVKGFWEGLL